MRKKEWQEFHGISDADMAILDGMISMSGTVQKPAKLTKIWDAKTGPRWGND